SEVPSTWRDPAPGSAAQPASVKAASAAVSLAPGISIKRASPSRGLPSSRAKRGGSTVQEGVGQRGLTRSRRRKHQFGPQPPDRGGAERERTAVKGRKIDHDRKAETGA